jgi:general secretion pathway protein A
LVAGAQRTDVFSPGAIDFIFRCSEGIPRNINNLCDNALLAGYAAGETVIGRSIIEDIADTFDMLPRADRGLQPGEEREAPARIFSSAGRSELWDAGKKATENETPNPAPIPVEQR